MTFLNAEHVSAGYGRGDIVRDMSFSVDAGQLVGILGGNGCGKTTLIKALCGILPHAGECRVDGRRLEGMPQREIAKLCGYIPQKSGLDVSVTVLDAVLMGFSARLGFLQYPDETMKKAALAALEQVGLAREADRDIQTLSEGQKQLCLWARLMVGGPSVLFLDEPESALDFSHRNRLLSMTRDWVRKGRRCALAVLHDPQLALNMCDELILMRDGACCGVLRPNGDDVEQKLGRVYGGAEAIRCGGRWAVFHKEGSD